MVKRAPDMTASDGTRWRVGIAALAIVLVAAVTVGVGAVSVRTSDDAITPLPAPNAVLPFSPATPTATPRVIAVPETSPAPTLAEDVRPTATAPPSPAALATTEPTALATVSPTPWLTIDDAPAVSIETSEALVPGAAPAPSPTAIPRPPAPSPTMMPPTLTAVRLAPTPTTAAPTIAPALARPLAFAAEDWAGGYYRGDGRAYGRRWVALYGADSAYPRATLSFSLEQAPVEPVTLTIVGLDDEWAAPNAIALEVNGKAIFTGASPFANWDGVGDGADATWTAAIFTIPNGALRAGRNDITLSNQTPGANFNAPPYVLLAEATLDLPADTASVTPLANERDRDDRPEKSKAGRDESRQKLVQDGGGKDHRAKPAKAKAKKAKPAGKGGKGHGKQKGKRGHGRK